MSPYDEQFLWISKTGRAYTIRSTKAKCKKWQERYDACRRDNPTSYKTACKRLFDKRGKWCARKIIQKRKGVVDAEGFPLHHKDFDPRGPWHKLSYAHQQRILDELRPKKGGRELQDGRRSTVKGSPSKTRMTNFADYEAVVDALRKEGRGKRKRGAPRRYSV
jgi:hypothetical protein